MAPSQLAISTSSLQRLVKEEASYFRELEGQEKKIKTLEGRSTNGNDEGEEDGNREFLLMQERKALQETRNVLPLIRERITNAREKLESLLDTSTNEAEVEKAKEVLKLAKEAQKDDPIAGGGGVGK